MARLSRSINGTRTLAIQLAPRSPLGRISGQVDSLERGLEPVQSFDFVAVGGGANGTGGNWTNNIFGTGGGGGGLAEGTITLPISGTVTVGAAENASSCFGQSGLAGSRGSDGQQPQYSSGGAGGGRTTTGGGNGGNGGKATNVAGSNGPTTNITGTTVRYSGGGGGAPSGAGGSIAGGDRGGGNGGDPNGGSATANTGGGGGGARFGSGGGGGSGIVIIKYPDYYQPLRSIAAGLTYTLSQSNGFYIYTFTAGTGTVVV